MRQGSGDKTWGEPLKINRLLVAALLAIIILQVSCAKSNDNNGIKATVREEALKVATESCHTFVARLNADFATVPGAFYDYILVPEDPANPLSAKIKVFYYGRMVAGQTPVVFFNGGPAGNSHSSYTILTRQQHLDNAWSRIPFIFIDQRGTGCSDAYPQGSSAETLHRLAHYGTRGIVSDAELIRQQLRIKKWKVFGQSYGAFLVHRYVVMAPDSVEAAYAHAGVITSDPFARVLGRIRAQNRVIETYLGDFPSDREVLTKIDAQLTPDVCFAHVGFSKSICGLEAIEPLLMELGFVDNWMNMHARFDLLLKDGKLDRRRVGELLNRTWFVPAEKGRDSEIASMVLAWSDRNVANEDKDTCEKIYAQLRNEGAKPEAWLFNECSAPIQTGEPGTKPLEQEIKSLLPQDLLTLNDFKNTLTSHPNLPFYLYSGAKDAYVPVDDYAEELGQVRSLIRYTHFLGTGHDGFYTEARVWEDLLTENSISF